MAEDQQYLHDVLAALVQCAHHGGTILTNKGIADAVGTAGATGRPAEGDDVTAAVTAANAVAAAAETAAAAAAEAAAAAVQGRSRSRTHLPSPSPTPAPHEPPTGPGNTLAASTDILMAFVLLHLLQVGFRPDVGAASELLEASHVNVPLAISASAKSIRGTRERPPLKTSSHHFKNVSLQVQEREVASKPSSRETANDSSHETSTTDLAAARADLKFRRQRRSTTDAKAAKLKSLRQPRGMQTFSRHLQLEQQRLRRLKALRLQQTYNNKFYSYLPHAVKHEVPRKHVGGTQLIRGKWTNIAQRQNLVDPVKGTPAHKADKKNPPTEAEIAFKELRSFLTSPTFARCAKMVSECGWNASAERGSYSMFMRLPPLSKYRFSLIGLPVAWHGVLVVNLALLPERSSRLERPSVTKFTQSHGPVGDTLVYTVAMSLPEYIHNTQDGPRLKLRNVPRLLHLLKNSLSRPAACAAQTASGILNPSFLGLPAKAAAHILYHLSVRDIAQVARTCRSLRSLCLQQTLWKHLLERDFRSRDAQNDSVDWRKEYIRCYRAENALKARTLSAMCPGVSDMPSFETLRNSLAGRKSCGVNVESVELLKDARKSVGPCTVKFAPIQAAATGNPIPTPIKPMFRPITRERSPILSKITSKSHGIVASPDEVLNSLCSFANTNLLENCNVNSFNFDEVFEKDLTPWNTDTKDQLKDKRPNRSLRRGNSMDLQTAPSKQGDSCSRLRKITPSAASVRPTLPTATNSRNQPIELEIDKFIPTASSLTQKRKLKPRHHKDVQQSEYQTLSSAARRNTRSTVAPKTRDFAFCQLINKPG